MTARRAAFLVVDLGFGDAGKGLLTDYLVRCSEARLVVRFNGGAQAGHNVIAPDGRHHTFSQFGAGSFVPGVRTHLAAAMVVHPTALSVEAQHLLSLGERDVFGRITVDPRCRVTTPFQQAVGRIRELLREDSRHGSCGVGVGETVRDSLLAPELTVHFGELTQPQRVRDRLFAQRAWKLAELESALLATPNPKLARELSVLSDPDLPDRWLGAASVVASQVRCTNDEEVAAAHASVIFEGAQGVLLDERFGFYPYTSFSKTTFDGALELLKKWNYDGEVTRIGVLRSHAVRHGAGPLPTEDSALNALTSELHNEYGPWQAHVRKGWPDLVLLAYALRACGGVDSLAVTHLDALRAFSTYRFCEKYDDFGELPVPASLSEQQRLTERLLLAKPQLTTLGSTEHPVRAEVLCELFERIAGVPVGFASYGPVASAVTSRP